MEAAIVLPILLLLSAHSCFRLDSSQSVMLNTAGPETQLVAIFVNYSDVILNNASKAVLSRAVSWKHGHDQGRCNMRTITISSKLSRR